MEHTRPGHFALHLSQAEFTLQRQVLTRVDRGIAVPNHAIEDLLASVKYLLHSATGDILECKERLQEAREFLVRIDSVIPQESEAHRRKFAAMMELCNVMLA